MPMLKSYRRVMGEFVGIGKTNKPVIWRLIKVDNGDFRIYRGCTLSSTHSLKFVAEERFNKLREALCRK